MANFRGSSLTEKQDMIAEQIKRGKEAQSVLEYLTIEEIHRIE